MRSGYRWLLLYDNSARPHSAGIRIPTCRGCIRVVVGVRRAANSSLSARDMQRRYGPSRTRSARVSSTKSDSGSLSDDRGLGNGDVLQDKPLGQVKAGLRSLSWDKPVKLKLVNHSGKEVQLYWVNYEGECCKAFKIEDGKFEMVDTFETHPWIAANARNRKVHHAFTINNNLVYYPAWTGSGPTGYVVADIRKAPEKLSDLHSRPSGQEVLVKFINRTSRPAHVEWINHQGAREVRLRLEPCSKSTLRTTEHTYWIATGNRESEEGLLLNYGWYYAPVKTRCRKERVYITDYI